MNNNVFIIIDLHLFGIFARPEDKDKTREQLLKEFHAKYVLARSLFRQRLSRVVQDPGIVLYRQVTPELLDNKRHSIVAFAPYWQKYHGHVAQMVHFAGLEDRNNLIILVLPSLIHTTFGQREDLQGLEYKADAVFHDVGKFWKFLDWMDQKIIPDKVIIPDAARRIRGLLNG